MGLCEALDAIDEAKAKSHTPPCVGAPCECSGKKIYPHSLWIASLLDESDVRRLTKGEVIAITEATIFEDLIEKALPKLREMVQVIDKCPVNCTGTEIEPGQFSGCGCKGGSCDCPQHIGDAVAFDNAQMYIEVAADFARGMAGDISVAMQKAISKARVVAVQ
jgi:hypothetical protein